MDVLETYPRDELFQTPIDELVPIARGRAAHPRAPPGAAVRAPRHLRPLPVLPGLPAARPLHDRGARADRARSSRRQLGGDVAGVHRPGQRVDAGPAALRRPARSPASSIGDVDQADLERRLAEAARSWRDDFVAAAPRGVRRGGRRPAGPQVRRLVPRGLQGGLPAAHRRGRPRPARGRSRPTAGSTCPSTSRSDARAGRGAAQDLPHRLAAVAVARCCRSCPRWASRSSTSGPTSSSGCDAARRCIYDFGLRYHRRAAVRAAASCSRTPSTRCGRATTRSTASTRLVLAAGLTWRQATVLRAYAKYMRQGGTPFAQDYIEDALQQNVDITRALVALFEARFDPGRTATLAADGESRDARTERDRGPHPAARSTTWPASTTTGSCGPTSRSIKATLRTNYYQADDDGPHQVLHLAQAASPRRSPTCPSRGRSSRSSSTRRGSRACTCASARWPAAACAGRTGATTSAPRCSAWSRRRWSRTP